MFLDRIRPHLAGFEAGRDDVRELATYLFSVIPGQDRVLPGGSVVRGLHSAYAQGLRIYHGPDIAALVGALLHMMRSLTLDYLDEFVRIRGGSVVLAGGGLLLATPAGGPEEAALVGLMLSKGSGYLGDEVALIDPVLRRLHPTPFPLLVDVDAATTIPGLDSGARRRRSRRNTAGRYAVAPEALGSHRAEPVGVKWLVLVSFDQGSPTRLDPVGAAEAVFGLSRASANLDVWEERGLMLFRKLAEEAAVSRLVVGDLGEAANVLTEAAPSLMATQET